MSFRNSDADNPSVLESQFILRLLPEPAKALRNALVNNSNLRDRVSIKIEPDMRQGEVRIDHWLLTAKVLDLPTIVESLKTIDGKGFYKTADICQMLVCKEDEGIVSIEDEPQNQQKSSRKVDKKYLYPHGITPPMKNVRKRRFRKTLKKKYVEAPEIEKEVKRLLREDNESVVPVKWEVINEDDPGMTKLGHGSKKTLTNVIVKREPLEQMKLERDLDDSVPMTGASRVVDDSICKIFGGAVSDSEDDADYDPDRRMDRDLDPDGDTADAETHIKFEHLEMDDNSQNSAEDSHLTDSNSVMNNLNHDSKILTEFSSEMFNDSQNSPPSMLQNIDFYNSSPSSIPYSNQNLSRSAIERRLEDLQMDLEQLKMRCCQHETDIENSDNLNLRQRLQDIRDRCIQDQLQKEQEIFDLQELLKD